jgi:mono/diheme cytochrome c family protein
VRVALAAVSLAAVLACGRAESPAAAYARDASAVERGRLIFVGTCGAYCHALTPERRDAPDLFDCEWKHGATDADLFRTISGGVAGTRMPAFAGALPEGETDVWKVIAFLRNRSRCTAPLAGPGRGG